MATTDYINKISQGNCLELMKQLDENSIDSIVTDPPYGLSFMGKKWDYDVPKVEAFEEMLRVAKCGATLLCFGGTRTWHRIAVNIEDAGWTIKDNICWLYGQGFPKATDISKQLDRKAGAEREVIGETGRDPNRLIKFKEQDGCQRSPTNESITAPSTPEARLWNGWKSHGLKPSFEPIILAMKPNDGSYAENALKWGVSGLNIDGCRIGTDTHIVRGGGSTMKPEWGWHEHNMIEINKEVTGRFPANTILGCACESAHDEDCPVGMLDEQSGVSKDSIHNRGNGSTMGYGGGNGSNSITRGHTDIGTASRFFYTAKASKSERNEGCEELEEQLTGMSGGAQSVGESYDKGQGIGLNRVTPKRNVHPTVKPLALMEYLCKLTLTPTGGIVLDPYAGSGTTLIAACKIGREFIGFEIEPDYVKIAEARIKPYLQQQKL